MDQRKLVKDCLKGLPQAQRQLYDCYAEAMLGVCYRYTKSVADAEDILQEGFIRVFNNLHQYRFEGELGAWIRRVMVRTALNYLKKNKRYSFELSYDEINLHPVSVDNPQIALQAKELANLIRQLPRVTKRSSTFMQLKVLHILRSAACLAFMKAHRVLNMQEQERC